MRKYDVTLSLSVGWWLSCPCLAEASKCGLRSSFGGDCYKLIEHFVRRLSLFSLQIWCTLQRHSGHLLLPFPEGWPGWVSPCRNHISSPKPNAQLGEGQMSWGLVCGTLVALCSLPTRKHSLRRRCREGTTCVLAFVRICIFVIVCEVGEFLLWRFRILEAGPHRCLYSLLFGSSLILVMPSTKSLRTRHSVPLQRCWLCIFVHFWSCRLWPAGKSLQHSKLTGKIFLFLILLYLPAGS